MALIPLLTATSCVGAIIFVTLYAIEYTRSPLKRLPGPFFAKFSDIWRLWIHYKQTHIETQIKLHARYGDFVRIGPKTVSIADPSLIRTIYSTRGTFLKSEYYSVNDALQDGHLIQNIFGTRSNEFHARHLKPIQKLYSFQSTCELESMMDDNLRELYRQLERRFMNKDNAGKTCDIGDWISYSAWDFLGDMTLSKRMGFMEQGADVDDILATAEKVMRYFSVVGQIPVLDKLLAKNPYLPMKFPDFSVAAQFCVDHFIKRVQNMEKYKDKNDFLNGFLQAKEEYPDIVSDNEVIAYLIINILGGADTTSIILKATIYHILHSPHALSTLTSELHSHPLSHPAPYSTLSTLPYLSACIKEALRMHPVVGHILERVVPAGGLALANGLTLPPGTVVGANPWVVHRRADAFGDRPDEFVPERWLRGECEAEVEYEARMKRMRGVDMSFGRGNRVCLGRPLAMVELYKVTAMLLAKYKIELEDPEKEWVLNKQWFVWPHGIKVKLSPY